MSQPSPAQPALWKSSAARAVALAALGILVAFGAEWAVESALEGWHTTTNENQGPNASLQAPGGRGRLLYQVHCTRCHGPEGRGDGPDGFTLRPPPRDLATAIDGWSNDRVRQSIVEGKRETAMPAFGQTFSGRELEALVAHVRSFRRSPLRAVFQDFRFKTGMNSRFQIQDSKRQWLQ